jgi:hypothetical protein
MLTAEEAEFLLRDIIVQEQQRSLNLLRPYMAELAHIEARKPPQPVSLPDGRTAVYVGPTAEQLGGPYRAPRWLEEMSVLPEYSYRLRRLREHLYPRED